MRSSAILLQPDNGVFKIDVGFLWLKISERFLVPKIEINGVLIHYQIRGKGSETIVFAHGLLWSEKIFENQISAFEERYRCLSFDFRGQGQSAVTKSGYDMETLSADTAFLIEALDAAPCHFVGVSMGGMVGLRIATRRPELIKSLALFCHVGGC